MIYRGRWIDPIALWGDYVDLPPNIGNPLPTFLPKIQCPNPAHITTKKHFQINTKKPLVHCFAGCGISGTYEHALAIVNGWKTKEGKPDERRARRAILRASRLPLEGEIVIAGSAGKRKSLDTESSVAKDQAALDGLQYAFLPKPARDWLDKRGIDAPARGKWQIGWDEDSERIVIPAYDLDQRFRFLIKRRIDGREHQKYLYTDGTIATSLLFGGCYCDRRAIQSQGLVLVEGSIDAIRLHQEGVTITTAILGSGGISAKQVRIIYELDPKRVYLFFDKDVQGVGYIEKAMRMIRGVPLFVMRYPRDKFDPAEMNGKEVERALTRALPIATFLNKTRNARKLTKEAQVA